MQARKPLVTLITLAFFPLAAAAGEVGQVTSMAGDVTATGPDGSQRPLGCGDSVQSGDTLSTGAGSHVGVLSGDYLTQVADGSSVRFEQTAEGAPNATLHKGRVRVIDVRDGGSAARLAAGDAEVRVVGNDAEAYLLSEKVGSYAMFCEWDAPLHVARSSESRQAAPGECVIAKPREPLYTANAHDARIPAANVETCPPDFGALASTDHFTPEQLPPVAAPPPTIAWSNPAEDIGPPALNPCETPGAICGAAGDTPVTGIIVADEVMPGLGPRPGGGTLPGGN